jgi:hypothetical protein
MVFKAGLNDPFMALKVLEKRFAKGWDKKHIEISGPGGGPIEMETPRATGDMNDAEVAEELAKLLAKANVRRLQAGGE